MEFEFLEEAGTLDVEYRGEPLDLYSFGVFHLNMQDIIDKVAFWLLSQEGLLEPSWKRPKYLPVKPPPAYRRFVRAEIREIQIGSLYEALTFSIAAVLADPDVRAVLQNLVANVIWAVSLSGVRGVIKRIVPPPPNIPPLRRRPDPFDIGPNLRDSIMAIAEVNSGRPSEITFKYRSPRYEMMEVTIRIGGQR
jgi:hypothetical protein